MTENVTITTMKNTELKPCPFCGTKPYTVIEGSTDQIMKGYISCNNSDCGAKIRFRIKAKNVFLDFDDVIDGLQKAGEAWNMRVNKDLAGQE